MNQQGKQMTLFGLFDDDTVVEIPIVQRDYAQGRESAREIRDGFLCAIFDALSGDCPLDLDFVYGSVSGSSPRKFQPLDGQQRLTTLFLLHWYLAWKDAQTQEFREIARRGAKSRFTYAVRPSSTEFFDFLVGYAPSTTPREGQKLSSMIADESGFFRSWKLDPTILSALEMLDSIDSKFAETRGLCERLVRTERPCITFQWLDLKRFELSDELYIKMNARGKALTPFEAFKAKLEQKLDSVALGEWSLHGKSVSSRVYVSERMDTAWTDIFWNEQKPELPDEKLMLMLRAFVIITRDPNAKTDALTAFLEKKEPFTFSKCDEHDCIDEAFVETMIAVLDSWSIPGESGWMRLLREPLYYDEVKMFTAITSDTGKPTYADFVQFHAYCAYIRRYRSDLKPDAFWEWMRVVRNLAANSDYGNLDAFQRSIRSVNDMLADSQNILAALAAPSAKVAGFNQQQVREERLKAQLLQKGDGWRRRILTAEQHGYFAGQIEFFFSFSGVLERWLTDGERCTWDDETDAGFLCAFDNYFAKAAAVFDADGLKEFGEFRWERALLSVGDYLLKKNSNKSFLKNLDRDISWKRLLQGAVAPSDPVEARRQLVKTLFDRVDLSIGVQASLDSVIANTDPLEEWRRELVREWRAIEYCENRMIRFEDDGGIYLLTGFRRSGRHAELFSYCFYQSVLLAMSEKGKLTPFTKVEYYAVSTNTEPPCAFLECLCDGAVMVLDIVGNANEFELSFYQREGDLPSRVPDKLIAMAGFSINASGGLARSVSRSEIAAAVESIVSVLTAHNSTAG